MDDKESVNEAIETMKAKIHQGELVMFGNKKDIDSFQEWQERQDGTLADMNQCLREIKKQIAQLQLEDIAALRLEMSKGKPSWTVTMIITILSSITVGAIVFALRVVGGL